MGVERLIPWQCQFVAGIDHFAHGNNSLASSSPTPSQGRINAYDSYLLKKEKKL